MTLAAEQFPRLLHAMPADGALGLQAHESLHGPLPRPPRRGAGHSLILELERAGLRGYGGGGFPTATKLAAVAVQRAHAAVVVNASEGEPLSQKDVLLVRHLPHLVIDGALVAAALLGSERVVFALDEGALVARQSVDQALAERSELAGRGAPAVHVAAVPRGYLTGQETALVRVLGGGPAKPAVTPPYPFERGLAGRPTLVSNAETYAQIGLVARYGSQWWRSLGTEAAPGTRLVTVSGAVAYPGVLEVAGGTTLRRLLEASGGVTEQLQGFLLGGYAGTWVGPDAIDLRIDAPTLRDHGAGLGPGIVFALPESACVVAEVASSARWLSARAPSSAARASTGSARSPTRSRSCALKVTATAPTDVSSAGAVWSCAAARVRSRTVPRASSPVPCTPSGRISMTTPTTARAMSASSPGSCRHARRTMPGWRHERVAARRSDRLRGARPLRRAVPGADLARRLGISGDRRRRLTADARARSSHGRAVPSVACARRAARRAGQAVAWGGWGRRQESPPAARQGIRFGDCRRPILG